MKNELRVTDRAPNIFQAIFHRHTYVVHPSGMLMRFCRSGTGEVWGVAIRRDAHSRIYQIDRNKWVRVFRADTFEQVMAVIRQ